MKFKQFLAVSQTPMQQYFKDDVQLVYASQSKPLHIAILPSYDALDPSPVGWVPAVSGEDESDFGVTIRAAKFVGHGNRRAKTSFLSPRTFDLSADDPYEAFYDYCSRSDKWSYLTKAKKGRGLSDEVVGAVFPPMRNYFVANVVDADVGSRGGVMLAELPESAAKGILYSFRKNGARVNGLAFERDAKGELVFGDITNPSGALVMEIAWGGRGYIARPAVMSNGNVRRIEIPETLLQHRRHMELPESFLVPPGSGQEIVDRIAGMVRGYKSEDGTDEIKALAEAMEHAYEKGRYSVDVDDGPIETGPIVSSVAEDLVETDQEKKVEAVEEAVERGVKREKYTPVNKPKEKEREEPVIPGEEISVDDIASVRAMLSGKR